MSGLCRGMLTIGLLLASAAYAAPQRQPRTTPAGEPRSALVDINSASVEELKTLPGIADAWANAIVHNRPYKNKAQLLSRKVIPRAAYLQIRALIIARQ